MSRSVLVAAVLLLTAGLQAQQIDLTGWFPFNPARAVAAGTAVDASDLLVDVPGEDPAQVIDRRGFLIAGPDGHFYFSNTGRRARFFGTNLTFHSNFPPNPDAPQQPGEYTGAVPPDGADQLATRLARMGVNLVRFHHMDNQNRPGGIWDRAFPNDTQHLDPLQVRRLDYLIYQFKRRGIYTNLNLHVSRFFRSGDGVVEYNLFQPGGYNKGATQFDPVMIELQKKYATDLLGHLNPYTGLRLAEEPAVAFVEITNEDSLLFSFRNDRLNHDPAQPETLPPFYSRQLDTLWNGWLSGRYGDTAALAQAWRGGQGDTTNRLNNPGFEAGLEGWTQNLISGAQASFSAVAQDAQQGARAARIEVTGVTGTIWHVQLLQRGLTIESGQRYEVAFAVRATPGFRVQVVVQQDISPFTFYHDLGTYTATGQWQVIRTSFRSNFTDVGHTMLVFNVGAATGTVWMDAVSFATLVPVGLGEDESLAAGTVRRPRRADLARYSDARARDLAQFYFDLERDYFDGMARHIRDVVGARGLVAGTAPYWFYPLNTEIQARLDFVDNHIYFDHPSWPAVPAWSPTGWVIRNRPFASDPFTSLFNIAASAVAGKPFTLSETNQPFPNDYQAEWLLWMSAFGNFQDWDEVLQFDYGGRPDAYFADVLRGFFAIAGNATHAAQMPAAARIFLGAQNRPAAARLDLVAGHQELLLAGPTITAAGYFQEHGVNAAQAFRTAVRIARFEAGSAPQYSLGAAPPGVLSSDNGELTLDRTDPARPLFQVNSASLHALAGFLAGKSIRLPHLTVQLESSTAAFAAMTLQPVGGRSLADSDRLLFTALTRHQNTGMVWNSARTSVDDRWGTAPTLVEPVAGTFTFRLKPGASFRVFALDAQGDRTEQVGAGRDEFQLSLNTGQYRTVWYELVAESSGTGARPAVNRGGVVNAANNRAPLAPGMLISIYGTSLSRATASAARFPLPVEIAGTSVLIGGRPAPLLYISPTQINAQVPFTVLAGEADVVVNSENGPGNAERVILEAAAPGIFAVVPATTHKGEYVSVFATGLGALASPLAAGVPAGVVPVATTVTATLGGLPAEVTYAGTAPGFAGLYQVNVRIPAEAPLRVSPLVIHAAGRSSNAIDLSVVP